MPRKSLKTQKIVEETNQIKDNSFDPSVLALHRTMINSSTFIPEFEPQISFGVSSPLTVTLSDSFVRKPDNSVDWRAMIPSEFVVINGEYKDLLEKRFARPLSQIEPKEVDDRLLLLLLPGIKEVAQKRGYESVDYTVVTASQDYVAVKCTITWLPFEGSNKIVFSALADAHKNNCSGFTADFLMAMAENRAFVRAVRNFLNIHILGKDEINTDKKVSGNQSNSNPTDPRKVLENKVLSNNKTFQQFKEYWANKSNDDKVLKWESFGDIPKEDVWVILGDLSKFNLVK